MPDRTNPGQPWKSLCIQRESGVLPIAILMCRPDPQVLGRRATDPDYLIYRQNQQIGQVLLEPGTSEEKGQAGIGPSHRTTSHFPAFLRQILYATHPNPGEIPQHPLWWLSRHRPRPGPRRRVRFPRPPPLPPAASPSSRIDVFLANHAVWNAVLIVSWIGSDGRRAKRRMHPVSNRSVGPGHVTFGVRF